MPAALARTFAWILAQIAAVPFRTCPGYLCSVPDFSLDPAGYFVADPVVIDLSFALVDCPHYWKTAAGSALDSAADHLAVDRMSFAVVPVFALAVVLAVPADRDWR